MPSQFFPSQSPFGMFLLISILLDENVFVLAGVYLKECNIPKKDAPLLSLSPCHFKMLEKDNDVEKNGQEMLSSHMNQKTRKIHLKAGSGIHSDSIDWSIHGEVVASLSYKSDYKGDEKAAYQPDNKKGLQSLIKAWFLAHSGVISSSTGMEVHSLVLGYQSLLHFEVEDHKFVSPEKVKASSNRSVENENMTNKWHVEILYVLTVKEESDHCGSIYEFVIDDGNKISDDGGGVLFFEKLELGDPVSFNSVKERNPDEDFSGDISSLSWMGAATSDVINSRYSL